MNKTEKKRAREKQTVSEMITLYCGKNHGTKHGGLCTESTSYSL